MKHLRCADLVEMTGLSRASIARKARNLEIPGAYRPDGVHFAFEDGGALRLWIEENRERREKFIAGRLVGPRPDYAKQARRGGLNYSMAISAMIRAGELKGAAALLDTMKIQLGKLHAEMATSTPTPRA